MPDNTNIWRTHNFLNLMLKELNELLPNIRSTIDRKNKGSGKYTANVIKPQMTPKNRHIKSI